MGWCRCGADDAGGKPIWDLNGEASVESFIVVELEMLAFSERDVLWYITLFEVLEIWSQDRL